VANFGKETAREVTCAGYYPTFQKVRSALQSDQANHPGGTDSSNHEQARKRAKVEAKGELVTAVSTSFHICKGLRKGSVKLTDPLLFPLTAAFYSTSQTPDYQKMVDGFEKMQSQAILGPENTFDELWKAIEKGRESGFPSLFKNGLDTAENQELVTTTDTMRAVHLVWSGLSRLFFEQ
jgi:hypothetical protein